MRHLLFTIFALAAAPLAYGAAPTVALSNNSGLNLIVGADGTDEQTATNGATVFFTGPWALNDSVNIYARCVGYGWPAVVTTEPARESPIPYNLTSFDCSGAPGGAAQNYGVTAVNQTTNQVYVFLFSCTDSNLTGGPVIIAAGASAQVVGPYLNWNGTGFDAAGACVSLCVNTNGLLIGATNLLNSWATTNSYKVVYIRGTWPAIYGTSGETNEFVNGTFYHLTTP